MRAENPNRLEVIKSALTHSREMLAAGPNEEIPLFTIEGLADTSISQLEQLEIHEEYLISLDGESAPHIGKINTPFRRELYQQLYSSAQKGILPTRDALVLALFIDELNNGMDRREAVEITNENIRSLTSTLGKNGVELISRAGHKGVYYNLPEFYQEKPKNIQPPSEPEPTATAEPNEPIRQKYSEPATIPHAQDDNKSNQEERNTSSTLPKGFFEGIANEDLPDPLELFKEGSATHTLYEFILLKLNDGMFPTEGQMKSYFIENGFSEGSFRTTKYHILSLLNKFVNPKEESRKYVRPEGLANQGFPVFTAPERKEREIQREVHPKDAEILVRISTFLPVEKAAATALFDRLQGNSITRAEWVAEIQKECPQHKITSYYLDSIIERLRDSGLMIASSKVKGETSYYRLGNK